MCEAQGYRASKAPGGAHGSLLNDGLAVLSGERFQNHGTLRARGILRLYPVQLSGFADG